MNSKYVRGGTIMDVSNHNITKYHSAAVSQTKNDHIQLYLVIMKVKKKII